MRNIRIGTQSRRRHSHYSAVFIALVLGGRHVAAHRRRTAAQYRHLVAARCAVGNYGFIFERRYRWRVICAIFGRCWSLPWLC